MRIDERERERAREGEKEAGERDTTMAENLGSRSSRSPPPH